MIFCKLLLCRKLLEKHYFYRKPFFKKSMFLYFFMQSPLRELEIERELSHELRDDLLFFADQFSSNLIIENVISRPLGVMLFCAERRSGGFGGAEPPRVGESQGRAGQGTFQRRKKERKNPTRQPSPQRPPCAQEWNTPFGSPHSDFYVILCCPTRGFR